MYYLYMTVSDREITKNKVSLNYYLLIILIIKFVISVFYSNYINNYIKILMAKQVAVCAVGMMRLRLKFVCIFFDLHKQT
jgi:hypothetical protein